VIAAKGSSVNGCLVATACADGEVTDELRGAAQRAHRNAIQCALETTDIDLIHFHGLDFHEYIPSDAPPMLATLHLPVNWYPPHIFHIPQMTLNFVSHSQAASKLQVRWPVICNGIDLPRYRKHAKRDEFLLVLARICPEKGIDTGLRVAHRLGLDLVVAGPVHPFASHQAYFREQVKPLLDTRRRYIGAVGREQKIDLLARAKCLLVPSSVAETSSLVAMEAIASGTPVVAFGSGALPEVIEHGATGFVVDSEEEMADAVGRISEISSERCRSVAAARFDVHRMVSEYMALYHRLRFNSRRQRRVG
jgi:glycosyltransferase involved in cell wall biosynthesis